MLNVDSLCYALVRRRQQMPGLRQFDEIVFSKTDFPPHSFRREIRTRDNTNEIINNRII